MDLSRSGAQAPDTSSVKMSNLEPAVRAHTPHLTDTEIEFTGGR